MMMTKQQVVRNKRRDVYLQAMQYVTGNFGVCCAVAKVNSGDKNFWDADKLAVAFSQRFAPHRMNEIGMFTVQFACENDEGR
jgi:hypothetical protein